MKLVIVESPTKAKTISKFLGPEFKVESSFGHIRDLPKSKIGIDVEKNFDPSYVIPTKSRKRVTELKKLTAKAEAIILATDEDREGEAIAWHLKEALKLDDKKNIGRIVFHEITKSAIEEALKNPRNIDSHLVDAQQARRILDRLVGYLLSPFLWKKLMRGLSAGRVQSAALKLIVEREEEIRKFIKEEYWTIEAELEEKSGSTPFSALLAEINGTEIPKLGIKNENDSNKIIEALKESQYLIRKIEQKTLKKKPNAPFTTSTLQQESNKRLRLSSKATMRFAQSLYEKGFITYMRTDSVNLSKESVNAAAEYIKEKFGPEYAKNNIFKSKSKLAQEAHEAIRPTDPQREPETTQFESPQEKKVYDLIWRRFISSQMPEAVFASSKIIIDTTNTQETYTFLARGSTLQFDGYLRVWPSKFEEITLPSLKEGTPLKALDIKGIQHFTEPPARYNEASLVKALEEYGIGRPSTYAPTISVIQDRNYVQKNEARRFEPTEIGELTNKLLREHFPEVVDVEFTAKMENELDEVAENKKEWRSVIRSFYEPFAAHLKEKYESVKKEAYVKEPEKTDEVCDKCGKPMVIKQSRYGKFLACSGFPECKNTKNLKAGSPGSNQKSFGPCPECSEGTVTMRKTKKGRFFYGCSRYPECKYATWTRPQEANQESAIKNTEEPASKEEVSE